MFEFHFDFLSPNAYLANKVIPAVEKRHGIECVYVPVSIHGQFERTNNKPTPVQIAGVQNKPEYLMLEIRRFCEKHGIEAYHRPSPFPFDSRRYLAGSVVATQEGFGRQYIDAIYKAAYEDQKDMTADTTHGEIVSQAGFPETVLAAFNDKGILKELEANLDNSVARGTFGSPSFFVGDELFFGKDRFDQIEAELVHQAASQ